MQEDAWVYLPVGVISSINPSFGQVGTIVTIAGVGMLGGGASVDYVMLGGVRTYRVLSSSNTVIIVQADAPPLVFANGSNVSSVAVTTSEVLIVSNTGARTSRSGIWAYRTAGRITDVVPSFGQQGTLVTIFGSALRGHAATVTNVSLAGVSVDRVVSESDTVVVVQAARRNSSFFNGSVIVFVDSGAMATLIDAFDYEPPQEVFAVTPLSGQHGTRITIEGSVIQEYVHFLCGVIDNA